MLVLKKLSMVAAILALGLTTACSEDKGPPDDGDDMQAKQKAISACDASFSDCALNVLASSGLSVDEVTSLSSCDFDSAKSTSSPSDIFEAAKQAVKASCE
ncbi:MAG TPA: hypothetical protein VM432_07070 [Bdellovibrionales bacterium]|jgi:hypothetical protein|nr:hypothetical protein [Bdellovibrionales bacterium]